MEIHCIFYTSPILFSTAFCIFRIFGALTLDVVRNAYDLTVIFNGFNHQMMMNRSP